MLEIFNQWAELEMYEHLQRGLQEAIAARSDWALILELSRHSADGSPAWTAMLYRANDVEPFIGSDVEAATALLDAYTQALEEERVKVNDGIADEEACGILWAIPQQSIQVERLYPNGEPHHITLQYGVKRKDWTHLEGKEFDAVIWESVWSDRVQLLRVRLPHDIPCCNMHPHITVSWVDGAEPAESNTVLAELIAGKHQFLPWNPRQHVLCRIEFHKHEEAIATGDTNEHK